MNSPTVTTGNTVDAAGVAHPVHYNCHPSGIEAILVCRHMPFNIGNAWKYLLRAQYKGAELQDLKKAQWYIQNELDDPTNFSPIPCAAEGLAILTVKTDNLPPRKAVLGLLFTYWKARNSLDLRYALLELRRMIGALE